jgi:hypothetical protein
LKVNTLISIKAGAKLSFVDEKAKPNFAAAKNQLYK